MIFSWYSGSYTTDPALAGPEQVFRMHIGRPVANFGVAVLSHAEGVAVEPHIVVGDDENHLAGYTALPIDLNPYRESFGDGIRVSAVILPAPGDYDVVFDTPTLRKPGRFTFRLWIDDTTPPSVRLLARAVSGRTLPVAVTDAGSGVDPKSLAASVDGGDRNVVSYRDGVARVDVEGLKRGRHTLRLTVADRQEAKNMEDVGPILPNTRTATAVFFVR